MRADLIVSGLRGLLLCSLVVLATASAASTATTRETFVAFAINMGTAGPTGARSVDINIDRLSTEAERDVLRAALIEKGPDGLLKALKKMPRVGFLQLPGQLGYDVRYVWQVPLEDGGRRILMATDRRIGFREARVNGSNTDYPFTVLELRLDKDDKGEGKLAMAAQIGLNTKTNTIEIANYSSEPVRLNAVHKP